MGKLYPQDRRGKEEPLPSQWTIFDRSLHEQPRGVLAALDDLTGWTADATGLEGAFGVSPACALWGEVGMFIDIDPAQKKGEIVLRPPSPLVFAAGSDLFELWVSGDTFDWQVKGAQFEIALLVAPAADAEETAVVMAPFVTWPTHSIRIVKIPEQFRQGGRVTGIRVSGLDPARKRRFSLDRLCAYRDLRKPLPLSLRPKRPLQLPEECNAGLNTGPGHLPFPTREETILPDNLTSGYSTRVESEGNGYRFFYSGNDAKISYFWSPEKDPLRVTVLVDGSSVAAALCGSTRGASGSAALFTAAFSGVHAEDEPLPAEALTTVPVRLKWRGEDVVATKVTNENGDAPGVGLHDAGRYGGSPVYHYFRELIADNAGSIDVELGPPGENLAVWLNGELIGAVRNAEAPYRPWNGVWSLPLRQGKNVLAVRFVSYPGGSFAVKPIGGLASWSGPWRVFGPAPYKAGTSASSTGVLPVLETSMDSEGATAVFDAGRFGHLTVRMRLIAKSLLVDITCPSGEIEVLHPGGFEKFKNGRVRTVPAMPTNGILLADGKESTLFFSLLHDWYRSNASIWISSVSCSEESASLQGPLCYLPRTDGKRNGVSERYFLTCSPVYEEVLPTIPNPRSPWAVEAGRYVYQESWGPVSFAKELSKAKKWVAFGMTNIMHLHHECGWQHHDASTGECVNDGCTLRLDVAPHKGGNEKMIQFLAAEQELGLRAGLYSNYTDYYPLNSLFCSDRTILGSDGSRQTAWVHAFKMKPSLAVEFDAWFAPRIAQSFHPNVAYTDVHTCLPPWGRVDYDERVPGAGTFAATFYSDGELLLNDQRHYNGPVFSEGGTAHWMYAGLVSGNYGQIGIKADDPPDPAFNLLKVHPLQSDVGLSVGTAGWIDGPKDVDGQADRYLLGVMTYGHIAYLPEMSDESYNARLLLRVYHMARAASSRYAGLKPNDIHYHDENDRWMSVSEAHARGLGDHCRLRVSYPGGMTFFANWSRTLTWKIAGTSEGTVELPPNGYLFDSPQGIICASVIANGRRFDRAQTPDAWYLDGRGSESTWGPITAAGSAALHIDAGLEPGCRLVDGGGNDTIRIAQPFAPRSCRAFSAEGEALADLAVAADGHSAVIAMVPGAVRYEWRIKG